MKFFKNVLDSIYNPAFYKALPKSNNSAFSYFLKLILILAVVQTLLLALPTFGAISEFRNSTLPKAISAFPANLTVKIQNGQASINQPEPYFVSIPKSDQTPQNSAQNFLVIDTRDPYNPNEFSNFSTLVLLTKNAIYYQQDSTGVIKSIPLKNAKDLSINRQFLNQQLNKYSPLLKFATPLILLLILAFLFLAYLLRLIYNLVFALIVWGAARTMDINLTYGQSYRIGIYSMTLSLIVEVLLRVASPILHFQGFPFMFTLISIGVFLVNFKTEKES